MSTEQEKEPKTPLPQPPSEQEQEDQDQEELNENELEKIAGGIISPRDAASGLATGKRLHKPL